MAKVVPTNIIEFFDELALLLENNIPLNEALNTLQRHQKNATFSDLIANIQRETEKTNLADALAKYPQYFESVIIDLIRSHQFSSLAPTIRKIADYYAQMENSTHNLNFKLLSTVSYFLIVIIIFSILNATILIYVIPTFKDIYIDLGGELPLITQWLISISDLFIAYTEVIIASKLIIIAILWWQRERILSYFPFFGRLYQKLALIHFLRTFGFMLSNGTAVKEAMTVAIQTMRYSSYKKSLQQIHAQLTSTTSLAEIAQNSALPAKVIRAMAVGEKAGQLNVLMTKLADIYTKQLNLAIEPAAKTLGVLLVFILGIIIGLFVIATYLPILMMAYVV